MYKRQSFPRGLQTKKIRQNHPETIQKKRRNAMPRMSKMCIRDSAYTAKHGLLNSRGNAQAFSDDSSYYLLCSLEILDEDGNLRRKADMFRCV